MKEETPIKTINPKLAYLNLAQNANFQKSYTTFTNIVNEFTDELDAAYEHHLALMSPDPIMAEVNFFKKMNEDLNSAPNSDGKFNMDFLNFWIDKYQTAHYKVKEELDLELGDDNIFFTEEFNESLISLRHAYFTFDKSTQHTFDTDSIIQDIPPKINGTTNEIIDYQTLFVTLELSKQTEAVFRQNCNQLGEPQKMNSDGTTDEQLTFAASTAPHGLSMVADFMHPNRMVQLASELVSILRSDLKGLYRLSYFMEFAFCHEETRKQSIGVDVEGLMVKVDFLGRKLINSDYDLYPTSTRNQDVLGVTGETISQTQSQPFEPTV